MTMNLLIRVKARADCAGFFFAWFIGKGSYGALVCDIIILRKKKVVDKARTRCYCVRN